MTTAQHPPRRILIVGAGLAGASAAAALREQGFDGDVTLFGQESHDPYELPRSPRASCSASGTNRTGSGKRATTASTASHCAATPPSPPCARPTT
ncbi:NAD(P)-binding protein [Streptomyces sp. NPDC048110]|uniref:NAD(P)-binding protein n=1 Tax=Streptomyces sp. NPDC048110 TaxID=3155483 RepID=UPI0033FF2BE7